MPMGEMILRRGRLVDRPQELVTLTLRQGRIASLQPEGGEEGPLEGAGVLDLQGRLISPPFIESHIHLDSALTAGEPRWNQSGSLFEGIEIWRSRKQGLTLGDVKTRALRVLRQQAQQGILFVRTHGDVSEASLTVLQALLEVREEVRDWMTLQVIAFPQDGIYSHPDHRELLERAMAMGVDGVGAIPHYELTREDGLQSLEFVMALAQRYGCLVDVHCDEIDDEQSRFLEVLAAYGIRTGLGATITASHTTAFGSYNNAYAFKLMGLLQRSGINIVANPLINLTLQGRADTYPKRRGLTRIKELWQGGINLSLGHDCIQDPWYNLGTGSMLDVAHMAIHGAQMTGYQEVEACFDMVTTQAARTLNLGSAYGLRVGQPANLIVLEAGDRFEAIRQRATVRYVIAQGRLLAENIPVQNHFYLRGRDQDLNN